MIKRLINIFYVKYIMENIVTYDIKIAEKENFVRLYSYNIWLNPKYMYKNKYVLFLRHGLFESHKHHPKDNIVYYGNISINEWHYGKCGTNVNLNFVSHFPDDLNVAIVHSQYALNKIQNFNKYFEKFTYELCHWSPNIDYLYLIRKKTEFKSII